MAGHVHQLWYPERPVKNDKVADLTYHHQYDKPRCNNQVFCLLPDLKNTGTNVKEEDLVWHHQSDKSRCNNPVFCSHADFKNLDSKQSLLSLELSNSALVCEACFGGGESEKERQEKQRPYKGGATAFVASLRTCVKNKDLEKGIKVHEEILKRGLLEKCSDALVTMYAKCGALAKAKELLDKHKSKNVSSWTALISGYTRQGRGHEALDCFEQMQCEGLTPDAVTFICVLKACGSIRAVEKGEQVYHEISRQELLGSNIVLGTALVDMYAKCGALLKAQEVLEELPSRDVVVWNALISGCAQHGESEQALLHYEAMKHEGFSPNAVTFACIVKACGSIRAAKKGEEIYEEIAKQGLLRSDIVLGNALVDMYAKCGALEKARCVLDGLPSRDVISWSTLISGYAEYGQDEQVLDCYEQMRCEGLSPNAVTFMSLLKVCGSEGEPEKGAQIHDEITRQGLLEQNVVLVNALIDMYAKCGELAKAQRVLEEHPCRNVVTWTTLMAGYAEHGQGKQALDCFERMQSEGLSPNAVTFSCILKACGNMRTLATGEQIHDQIAQKGLLKNNTVLGNALVDMYAKCGAMSKAQHVMEELPSRDVVSWNTLLAGYAQHGKHEQVLNCYRRMQHDLLSPTAMTYCYVLKACGSLGAAYKGGQIHHEVSKRGLHKDNVVLGSALVDMYAKCGALAKAQGILEEFPLRNVFSWSALMAGYAQHGQGDGVWCGFKKMQCEGTLPDAVTFSCILNACSQLGLVEKGYLCFSNMCTNYGIKPDLEHYTCMIDLLGRSGQLDQAVLVVEEMQTLHNSVTWSTLLGSCRKSGDVNIGRWAYQQAVRAHETDAPAYLLMANIYTEAAIHVNVKSLIFYDLA